MVEHAPHIAVMILLLPLIAALLIGLTVRKVTLRATFIVTCGAMWVATFYALILFLAVTILEEPQRVVMLQWVQSGSFSADWILRVDSLTAVMLLLVTSVSAVVHTYSMGYMSHDEYQPRFMAYLSLFTFFMLLLVTSDNLLQLFVGWEGVGLCSYLLIGFWYKKPEANAAAMKAFLVNRVGDIGFALGVTAVFFVFNSIRFDVVFGSVSTHTHDMIVFFGHPVHALTLICILLFIGAMGKSAQLGLHTWLPDAMEGPTPVSALIHAATMVTAGVFLVARCSPLFEEAPVALRLVTIIGASTAFFAATIGMVQNDIKRVIAYSTCSQLGYMFFACGVSAYGAGIFHLFTHGFFKALLFLGAGSVIHALSGEQDMRKMGGVWKKIPYTYAYMWIGSLALAGLPFFAGYYSKDVILEAAYAAHSSVGNYAFALGSIAAFLTAFYSWRLLFMTFHGAPRASDEVMHHVHESPRVMLLPLLLLAFGAVASGYIGYELLGMVDPSGDFWAKSITVAPGHDVLARVEEVPAWVSLLPSVLGIAGIALAYLFYIHKPELPARIAGAFPRLYRFLLNKWYFDELYDAVFVRPAMRLGTWLWKVFDTQIIDGLGPNGAAWISARLGVRASRMQTGYLYHYAFVMLIGLVVVMGGVMYAAGRHAWAW